MKSIEKSAVVSSIKSAAFNRFVNELNEWWPREYTWSQDTLKEIRMDAKKGGLCTEIGPYGFRCDWGRITEFKENERIDFKWQISSKREPVPNPNRASQVVVEFDEVENDSTTVRLEHKNFENHGDGAEEYMAMMDSPPGWDYILNCYREYCERQDRK